MQVFREDGICVDYDKVRCNIGIGPDQFLPVTAGIAPDTHRGQKLMARQEAIFREQFLPKLQVLPGTHPLLERMHSVDLKLMGVSCASEELSKKFAQLVGISDLISGEKPFRTHLETALSRLGTYPVETLLLADTPFDIEAGLRLGIQSIAFRAGGWMNDALEGAIAIYDDPHDLLENFEPSPLGISLLRRSA